LRRNYGRLVIDPRLQDQSESLTRREAAAWSDGIDHGAPEAETLTSTCVTPENLQHFIQDELPASEADALMQHLDHCDRCQEKLIEWQRNAAFLERIQQAPTPVPSNSHSPIHEDTTILSPGTTNQPSLPPDSFPGYEILEEIGRGGQGAVYRAYQLGTKREVAIKVLLDGHFASEQTRRRFEREIELVGQLRHPYIVTVFQPGVTDTGLPYYVMDYVPGQPLNAHIIARRLKLNEALKLFNKICDAVQYAHQRGIIHRDLKPSNILVDKNGNPQILDFGLARQINVADDGLTATGQIMGTLPYMSPEQVRGETDKISLLTDVYALGVILFKVLSGSFPYPVAVSQFELVQHIKISPPVSLSRAWTPEHGVAIHYARRRPSNLFDHDIETIVLRTLSKEPEMRYQSAGELAADIDRYLNSEPIDARRDSTLYVFRKWVYRNRITATVVATVLCLLVSTSAISTYFYLDARQALQDRAAVAGKFQSQAAAVTEQTVNVKAMLHRQSLGWFLNAWNQGDWEGARQIMQQVPEKAPERIAMCFLLDDDYQTEQLQTDLANSPSLANFVIGERAFQIGDLSTAKEAFSRCVNQGRNNMLNQAANSRLSDMPHERTD
jgi:serine/threonine protein kinase